MEKLLLDHVVKHRSDTSLSKVRVRQSNDGIEILPENAVFLLNIAELLTFNHKLRTGLAKLASSNSKIVSVEMPAQTSRTKGNISFLIEAVGCPEEVHDC